MTQSWSGAFPDLNGDPNAADTYTVDKLTEAIWVSNPCSHYKDVACNWGEISRIILEARKRSKDPKEAGPQNAQEEDTDKEEEGAGTAAAVEQAGVRDAAANAAADGEAKSAGRQDDEAAAPGAAAAEAEAADNMQLQDADVKKLDTLPKEEFEEPEEGCNSLSFSPTPGQGVPEHSASIGHDAAEDEAAEEQTRAERDTAKQRCKTAALAIATSTRKNDTEGKDKLLMRANK